MPNRSFAILHFGNDFSHRPPELAESAIVIFSGARQTIRVRKSLTGNLRLIDNDQTLYNSIIDCMHGLRFTGPFGA